jgi:hypothetical protein
MVVCPICGSTLWITFSNNSGEPDGKNIQMQHPGENFTILKFWEKNNEPYALGTKFFADFLVTLDNGKTFKVGPGKYFLPEGFTAEVEETNCTAGFELIKVELNGEDTPLGAVSGIVGGDVVAFTNRDEPDVEIVPTTVLINATVAFEEEYYIIYHKPVYKVEEGSKSGTIVSKSSTSFTENGHTYFPAANGTHEMALSNPSNTGLGLFFTVEERADGWYVVLDEKIVSASIGAVGFDVVPSQSDFRAPSHRNITREYGPIRTFVTSGNQGSAPVYTGDGYLYVHFGNIAWSYETTEIVGCQYDKTEGPFYRPINVTDYTFDVSCTCDEAVLSGSALTFNHDCECDIFVDLVIAGVVEEHQEQHEVISVNSLRQLVANPGGTINFNFGTITVVGDDLIICDWCQE